VNISVFTAITGYAAILGAGSSTGCPRTSPRMLPPFLPSPSPYSFIIFPLCCISTGPHSFIALVSFSPRWDLFNSLPPYITPIICLFILPSVSPLTPPRLPPSLSSPVLQTVQRLVYILLVEAGHVSVHVLVVVADVALCAPVGHRAKPERRREFVGILELLKQKQGTF